MTPLDRGAESSPDPKAGTGAKSTATARAYLSDLRHLAAYWDSLGRPIGIDELQDRHLFTYLVALLKAGRRPSTLRRRLTAVRSFVTEHGHGQLTLESLHALEDRVLALASGRTAALVVSNDTIMRDGLTSALGRQGVLAWPERLSEAIPETGAIWDYVLVWLPARRGIDPYSSVDWIARAADTGVPVVALYPSRISDLVRLRLAEAGARYALSQTWLSENIDALPEMLSTASLPLRFHLETPLALRQRLGLLLSGQLAPLLAAATELDERVWRDDRMTDAPRPSRSDIQRLRTIAHEEAGIPPPVGRYSTAVRNAPTAPDWRDVQKVVRQALNLGM